MNKKEKQQIKNLKDELINNLDSIDYQTYIYHKYGLYNYYVKNFLNKLEKVLK